MPEITGTIGVVIILVLILQAFAWFFVPFYIIGMAGEIKRIRKKLIPDEVIKKEYEKAKQERSRNNAS